MPGKAERNVIGVHLFFVFLAFGHSFNFFSIAPFEFDDILFLSRSLKAINNLEVK